MSKLHVSGTRFMLLILAARLSTAAAEEQQPSPPPTLPEVVVEEQLEGAITAGEFFEGPVASGLPSISGGTLFSPSDVVGYGAAGAATGTKIAIAPLDFPGSVETIPRDLIDDQSASSLYDLLRDVSSMTQSIGGSANRSDDLLIRGFRVQGNTDDFRKNGFRDSSRVQRELANIDRIEVLKGPASVLYGAVGEPAGLVNFITKQPLDYRYDAGYARFGYFDFYRFTVDSTGPLLTGLPLTYRLNIAEQSNESFRDFVFNDRFFIAPVLRWQISDRTRLTLEGDFLYDERMTDRGIPLYQGSLKAVPISRFLGEPADFSRFNDGQVTLVLDHELNDCWSMRTGWVSNWSDEDRVSTDTRRLGGGGGGGGATQLQRRLLLQDAMDENHYLIADLAGETWLLGMEHRILFGTEMGVTMRNDFTLQGNATSIDILNPVYGLPQPTPTDARNQAFDNEQYAVYLQDLISLTPRLKLLAGFRYDWVDLTTLDTQAAPSPVSDSQKSCNPRFGAVYQLVEDVVSVYAAYSESFQPVVGSSLAGLPFQPERGESYETGLKVELLNRRLWATVAAFDTTRQGILVPDPADPDYSIQIGEAQSKGVEFDLAGRLSPTWKVIANAAYVDARVTEDAQANLLRNRLPNAPYFSSGLWSRYDFVDCRRRTTGAGLGYVYVGHREGDAENSYDLPSYGRWDVALYHRWRVFNVGLYAENLFDAFYIASSRNTERNLPGAPFNLRGTLEFVY